MNDRALEHSGLDSNENLAQKILNHVHRILTSSCFKMLMRMRKLEPDRASREAEALKPYELNAPRFSSAIYADVWAAS